MNLWIFLIGYGAMQSLLLIYLLVSMKSKQNESNKYLISILIIMTFIGVNYILVKLGYRQIYPNLFVLGFSPMFLVPPLYFLFISSTINKEKFTYKTLVHIVPFFLFFAIQYIDAKIILKKIILLAFVIQLISYCTISYKLLKLNEHTNAGLKPSNVLKLLTACMLIFAISVFTLYLGIVVFHINNIDLTSIVIVFLIVFITILEAHMIKNIKTNFSFSELKKYNISNLKTSNMDDLGIQLNQLLVVDKIFLDSNLNPTDLANQLKISRHQLSEYINQELDCTFNDLINRHRVDYIKNDLLNKKKNYLSISGIANEAGFNSSATFYRVFKNQTGFTPSEYIKRHS